MGIKGYYKYITTKFNIIQKPYKINTLCIDLNGILHTICSKSTNENFGFKLIKELNKIIKKNKPKKIALFIDGQAPLAKVKLQKKRREKYLYSEITGFNPLQLTPGTKFIKELDNIVNDYLSSLDIETYYSSSTEKNEGELKLFSWLEKQSLTGNTVIHGNDADLIVLGIRSNILNLYIYSNYSFISIDKFVKELSQFIPMKYGLKYHPIRQDYCFLSLLVGNDYLPSLTKLDKLLNAYAKIQKNKSDFIIKKDKSINLKALKKLLENLKIPSQRNNSKEQVYQYFQSLLWNYSLYSGIVSPNFIPQVNNINLKSLLKFYPTSIKLPLIDNNWINSHVNLLLLMPLTGKYLLPDKLQYLMDDDSPIKDLYPEPCPICIEFKKGLSELHPPDKNASSEIRKEFSIKAADIHKRFNNHKKNIHPNKPLAINRIKKVLGI